MGRGLRDSYGEFLVNKKEKTLNCFKKMVIVTTIILVVVAVLLAIAVVAGMLIGGDTGVIILVGSLVATIVGIIGYALIARKTFFKEFAMYYEKVDLHFDGLDEQEIDRLKPNKKEETYGYFKQFFYHIVVTLVIFFVWYVFDDTCKVEIHRIKSGRYKRSIGFRCKECKTVLDINFSEMETYMNAPENEYGVKVVPCKNCNQLITLYSLESFYDE